MRSVNLDTTCGAVPLFAFKGDFLSAITCGAFLRAVGALRKKNEPLFDATFEGKNPPKMNLGAKLHIFFDICKKTFV